MVDWDKIGKQIFKAVDGIPAIFTRSNGDPVDCNVCLDFDVEMEPVGFEATFPGKAVTLEAMLSELGEQPKPGQKFIVDTGTPSLKTWIVGQVLNNDNVFVKMAVYENRT